MLWLFAANKVVYNSYYHHYEQQQQEEEERVVRKLAAEPGTNLWLCSTLIKWQSSSIAVFGPHKIVFYDALRYADILYFAAVNEYWSRSPLCDDDVGGHRARPAVERGLRQSNSTAGKLA